MRILLITDQAPDSNHSAIEGIFRRSLKDFAQVDVIYFDRSMEKPKNAEGKLVLPYKYKRRRTMDGIGALTDLATYDVVIVRNFFSVLKQVQSHRKQYGYRVGFWESFPHSFRRIYEARTTGHAVLRKTVEYAIKRRRERRLIERCDFYLPITATYKTRFHPDLQIPCHPLPMGVDFSRIDISPLPDVSDRGIRFIYVGAVDRLRRIDLVVSAFSRVKGDFVFDLYTPSRNELVEEIRTRTTTDARIRVHPARPRDELFRSMREYDVGVGLIPETPLYEVSSPTKTLEYYAAGIPAIINRLPEYTSLFNEHSAFLCALTERDILQTLTGVMQTSRARLREMGNVGRQAVSAKRDYAVLAAGLFRFLEENIGNAHEAIR
ncbi:MAG: glycosyltransferase family protein [Sulfuricaulis sp.]